MTEVIEHSLVVSFAYVSTKYDVLVS